MKYPILLVSSLVLSAPALAQDDPNQIIVADTIRDSRITVVATGNSERLDNQGQSIAIVTGEEIAQVQGADLTRVLERLPGVTFARNGGIGSTTGLFVRGASSQQLVVTVDGVRMADVAAPSGGFDLGTLLSGGIGKLELLRGSNSVAYGSDALGGVLAVTSSAVDGASGSVEYGAHDTLTANGQAGLVGNGYYIGAAGGYLRSDSISAFAGGTEPDAFRQWNGTLRGGVALAEGLWLKAVGRYADSQIGFDGFPPPTYATFADTAEYQTTRQGSGRVGLDYFGNGVNLAAGLALSDTRRAYFDPAFGTAPGFETAGRGWRADFTGDVDLADHLTLDFGADSEWTRFDTTFDPRQTARLSSAHALLGFYTDALNLTAGARLDDSDRFGSRWTFGANANLELSDDWRLRASYGEGFKAPTLYQLYGYGGNVALRPETSRAGEIGIELGDRNGERHVALTVFRRDSKDLIDYIWPTGYFNTARARAVGVEAEAAIELTEGLRARATYSYVKSTNPVTGTDLARRPRHALSLGADWTTPLAGLAVGADLRTVSSSFDDAGNFTALAGYSVVTLRASMPLGEHFELFGRVENVGNVKYFTAADYGNYGRSAYAGIRAKF